MKTVEEINDNRIIKDKIMICKGCRIYVPMSEMIPSTKIILLTELFGQKYKILDGHYRCVVGEYCPHCYHHILNQNCTTSNIYLKKVYDMGLDEDELMARRSDYLERKRNHENRDGQRGINDEKTEIS